MTEKIIARQIDGGLWQWRQVFEQGGWASEYYSTGDAEAIANTRSSSLVPALLGLGGQHVMGREIELEAKDKRHIAKLLPYEMEEFLIDNVDDLHFVHSAAANGKVLVHYVKKEVVAQALQQMQEVHCDVPVCVPEYLYLLRENDGATIVHEDNKIIAHLSEGHGFSVDLNLAPIVLAGITTELGSDKIINLVAASQEKLDTLKQWLPKQWQKADGPEIQLNESGFWDWVDPEFFSTKYNLRRGRFARQLPFKRWYHSWKIPAFVTAAAFLLSVLVTFGEYLEAKSASTAVRAQIAAVYQQAIPGGKPRDPERELAAKVKTIAKKTGPTNFMVLFNAVASSMAASSDVKMANVRYNADQRELQLNLESSDFTALESVRSGLAAKGYEAEFMRVDKQANLHNAKMKVVEAAK